MSGLTCPPSPVPPDGTIAATARRRRPGYPTLLGRAEPRADRTHTRRSPLAASCVTALPPTKRGDRSKRMRVATSSRARRSPAPRQPPCRGNRRTVRENHTIRVEPRLLRPNDRLLHHAASRKPPSRTENTSRRNRRQAAIGFAGTELADRLRARPRAAVCGDRAGLERPIRMLVTGGVPARPCASAAPLHVHSRSVLSADCDRRGLTHYDVGAGPGRGAGLVARAALA